MNSWLRWGCFALAFDLLIWLAVKISGLLHPGVCRFQVVVDATKSAKLDRCLEFYFYRYQSLVGAFAAIGAAFLGGYFLDQQTRRTAKIEAKRHRRELDAARAVMPLSLMAICNYASECAHFLQKEFPNTDFGARQLLPPETVFPSVPATSIATLEKVIQFCRKTDRVMIAALLNDLQTQAARLESLRMRSGQGSALVTIGSYWIVNIIIDTADLYAKSSISFNFARQVEKSMPTIIEASDVRAALFFMGFSEDEYSTAYDRMQIEYPRPFEGGAKIDR